MAKADLVQPELNRVNLSLLRPPINMTHHSSVMGEVCGEAGRDQSKYFQVRSRRYGMAMEPYRAKCNPLPGYAKLICHSKSGARILHLQSEDVF